MRLEPLLRAHGFMKVEQPPLLWEAETEDVRFVPLLGEMIAAGLAGGSTLAELTLNASNIVVSPDDDVESLIPAPGEYVGITVSGQTTFGPDERWHPSLARGTGVLARLHDRLETAGARFAYIRSVPPKGSFTVFFDRHLSQ